MDTIRIRNIATEMPSNWGEINLRNLLYLAGKFPFQKSHGFALYFFFHCMNLWRRPFLQLAIALNFMLSKKLNLAWKNDEVMEYGEENIFEESIILALSQLNNFEWIQKDIVFEKCLLNKITFRFSTFYGPREYLANVTADEFRHAEFFFVKFSKTANVFFLDRLIATLWREKAIEYNAKDIRKPFSEFELEIDAPKISKLSRRYKYACLLIYMGMRNYFVNTDNAKKAFDSEEGGTGGDILTNWGLVLLRLAESSVFGNAEQIKAAFIDDIILHLSDLKERHEKEKYRNQ